MSNYDNKTKSKLYIKKNMNQKELIKEKRISVSLENKKNKIMFQMENCICRVYLKNGKIGVGFFCKFTFNNKLLSALITNNHILIDNDKIKLIINNKDKIIKIDNSREKFIGQDIAIIEIKPNKDKIQYILYIIKMKKLVYQLA